MSTDLYLYRDLFGRLEEEAGDQTPPTEPYHLPPRPSHHFLEPPLDDHRPDVHVQPWEGALKHDIPSSISYGYAHTFRPNNFSDNSEKTLWAMSLMIDDAAEVVSEHVSSHVKNGPMATGLPHWPYRHKFKRSPGWDDFLWDYTKPISEKAMELTKEEKKKASRQLMARKRAMNLTEDVKALLSLGLIVLAIAVLLIDIRNRVSSDAK